MSKQTKRTEWLENLRINSFEIEILLVGFVLILLFQLSDVYDSYMNVLNRFDFVANNTRVATVIFGINLVIT